MNSMSETSRAPVVRDLSSLYGDPSPFPTKHGTPADRRWTENFSSEPFHSTPKSSDGMPSSISYPTLLSCHAGPSPPGFRQSGTPSKKSPLAAGADMSKVGLMGKRSSSVTELAPASSSPHRLHSSPASLLQGSPSPKKSYASDLENTTIQKQRRELQLLIHELQDRDRELNEMVASHQRQLLAWEQDRQKLLALETKCARYEGELKNRSEYIKSLKTRLKVVSSQDQSKACALETMQQQLRQLSDGATAAKQQAKEAQEDNAHLKATMHNLSEKLSHFEAREQELSAVIKLKEKDLLDASSHISDLTGSLKKLDLAHKEARQHGESEKKQVTTLKRQLNESQSEMERLKSDLSDRVNNSTQQRIEVGKLKEELKALQSELELAGEREKRKDQLLDLQRSKQERTDAELTSLRQAYERQQRELSLLQLSAESQRERSKTSESLKVSVENSSFFDSKPTTPVKGHLSSSISPVNGGSPLVSSAGEGVMANHSSVDTEELLDANHTEQLGLSPTSKLHRLLTESRQMVENLEQSTLPPYVVNATNPRSDQVMWPR
ncbi:uncharacterized protein [Diadema antillarum]|uniref:uncharacterized protein n=1 Tax=Diadema antillarum TaxID=105358 RepID=UPI003A87861A